MNTFRLKRDVNPTETETAINDYLAKIGVTVLTTCLGETKRDDWTTDAWRITLRRVGRADWVIDYFTGTGHRVALRPVPSFVRTAPRSLDTDRWIRENVKPHNPEAAGVIYSMIMDSSASGETFKSWCDNFGYDTDSRKALATYEACQQTADNLNAFFSAEERQFLTEALEDY